MNLAIKTYAYEPPSKKEVVQAMCNFTFSPLGRAWEPKALNESRYSIEKLLAKEFMEKL